MSYTVGYKKPPRHGQFKKGKSGNPSGRPKGARNLTTLLDNILFSPFKYTEAGKPKSSTRIEFILKRLVADGMKGDNKAVQILFGAMKSAGTLDTGADQTLAAADHEQILRTYLANMMADSAVEAGADAGSADTTMDESTQESA